MDLEDLKAKIQAGHSIEEAAQFLCRADSIEEVERKARELGSYRDRSVATRFRGSRCRPHHRRVLRARRPWRGRNLVTVDRRAGQRGLGPRRCADREGPRIASGEVGPTNTEVRMNPRSARR
jgi:hypothetical protein